MTEETRWYRADAGRWSRDAQDRTVSWCHGHATGTWRFSRVVGDGTTNQPASMEVLFRDPSDHVLFLMTRE
jgi:hypothetical protein